MRALQVASNVCCKPPSAFPNREAAPSSEGAMAGESMHVRVLVSAVLLIGLVNGCGEPPPVEPKPCQQTGREDGTAACAFAVTGITPARAARSSLVEVTIEGVAFAPEAVVKVGGKLLLTQVMEGPQRIRGTLPYAEAAGTVDVTVERRGRDTQTLVGGFTYIEDLRLLSTFPAAQEPGLSVPLNLFGTGFTEGPITVEFAGQKLEHRVLNDGTIEVQTPATTPVGIHPVTVTRGSTELPQSLEGGFSVGGWVPSAAPLGVAESLTWMDANTVFALSGGRLLHSVDGGRRWRERKVLGGGDMILKLEQREGELWALTWGAVARSTDRGESWSAVRRAHEEKFPRDFTFDAEGTLYVLGAQYLERSPDRGATWEPIPVTTPRPLERVAVLGTGEGRRIFVLEPTHLHELLPTGTLASVITGQQMKVVRSPRDPSLAVVLEGGTLRRTRDGGVSWSLFGAPSAHGLVFNSDGCAWSFGTSQTRWTCTLRDDVPVWQERAGEPAVALAVNADRALLGANGDGTIWRAGHQLTAAALAPGLPGVPVRAMVREPQSPGRLAIIRGNQLFTSADEGKTWVPRSPNEAGFSPDQLLAERARTGWSPRLFAFNSYRWMASEDFGATWTQGPLPVQGAMVGRTKLLPSTEVRDRLHLLASGQVYLSEDGGMTWTRRPDFEGRQVLDLAVVPRVGGERLCIALDWGVECQVEASHALSRLTRTSPGGLAVEERPDGNARLWTVLGDGLYVSDELQMLTEVRPPGSFHRRVMAFPGEVIAFEGESSALWSSKDGGERWTSLPLGLPYDAVQHLAGSAADSTLWIGGPGGLFRSGPAIR